MANLSYGIAVVDATGYDYSSSSSQTVTGLYAQIDKAYKSKKTYSVVWVGL